MLSLKAQQLIELRFCLTFDVHLILWRSVVVSLKMFLAELIDGAEQFSVKIKGETTQTSTTHCT